MGERIKKGEKEDGKRSENETGGKRRAKGGKEEVK
jgi:hypothetical protein